jgi:coproporphyrinogen III oxidase-like Fe-S oxidoreductase
MIVNVASQMMRRKLGRTRYIFQPAPAVEMRGHYGIYLNVPFCPTRCSFCPFYAELVYRYAQNLDRYVHGVVAEIRQSRLHGRPTWLYTGGGTPNTLTTAQLGQMISAIKEQVEMGPMGIELLPALVTPPYLQELREIGFSRISMGVQSLDEQVVRRTGRTCRMNNSLADKVKLAQSLGFWVSLDLMVGLQDQTPEQFARDMDAVIQIAPDQVAVYPIIHVRGVDYKFKESLSSARQYELIESVNERMAQHGYGRQTAWIFARNTEGVYDTSGSEIGMEYVGFGAGAYSVFGKWKVMNPPVRPYLHGIEQGQQMAFVSPRGHANEEMRRVSKMIYNLQLDDAGLQGMSRLAVNLLSWLGYARRGVLTAKGRYLAHEISRAGMEALPFPIQDVSSVLNYDLYQQYQKEMDLI